MKLCYSIAGLLLIVAGIPGIIHSFIGGVIANSVYFSWSFTFVPPFLHGDQLAYSTYEVLLPWLLIGIALMALGIFVILKGRSDSNPAAHPSIRDE